MTERPNLIETPKNVGKAPLCSPLPAGELHFTTIDLKHTSGSCIVERSIHIFLDTAHLDSEVHNLQVRKTLLLWADFKQAGMYVFVNPRGPSVQVGSGSVVSYAHLAVDQASGREGKREKRAITIGSRSLAGYRSYLGAGASIGNSSMVGKIQYCDAI